MFNRFRCFLFGHRWHQDAEPSSASASSWCSTCGLTSLSMAPAWPVLVGHLRAAVPGPMPEIRAALIRVADAHAALQRGGNAWNATQLTDALTSAEFFIKAAREAMDNYTPPKPMPVSARGLQAEGRPVDAYEAALNASGANVNPAPHYAKPPPPPAPPPPQEWGG